MATDRDSYPRLPDAEGQVVFDATCPLDDMARAIAQGARNVLDQEGVEGYKRKWIEYPFPTALLERVESRLGAP